MTDLVLVVVLLAAAGRRAVAARGTCGRSRADVGTATEAASRLGRHPGAGRGDHAPDAAGVPAAARGRGLRDRRRRRRLPGRDGRGRAVRRSHRPAGHAPPPGWTGKAWACHVGARAASGDLLLFLDADTVLAPDALGGLLELHDRHGGLVSVQPFHGVVRPYEQLSSYFNVVSLLASAAFARRPATAAHGLRALPADVARGLRARRRARRGAGGDPRRRRAGGRLRPGRPAGAVRRRRAVDPDAELSRRDAAAGRRVDEELRLRRVGSGSRTRAGRRAVGERPSCRRRRSGPRARRGRDRAGSVPDLRSSRPVGGRLGGRRLAAADRSCAGSARSAGGPGCCFPRPCSRSTSSSRGRPRSRWSGVRCGGAVARWTSAGAGPSGEGV